MLKNLLNPGLNSDSAEQRLQAIEKLDANSQHNQIALETIVVEDSDAGVRRAAMNKLNDALVVFKLSQTKLDDELKGTAHAALQHLLGAKTALSNEQFLQLTESEPAIKPLVLQNCPHAEIRDGLMLGFSKQELVDLLGEVDYTDTRQKIAELLDSEDLLEKARAALKGRDKSAEKIIRSALDNLHREQRDAQDSQSQAVLICEKMEYLASHEWRPEFKAMHAVWLQRWEALEFSQDNSIVLRFDSANQKVAHRVTEVSALEVASQKSVAVVNSLDTYAQSLASLSIEELKIQQDAILKIQSAAAEDRLAAVEGAKLTDLDEARFTVAQETLSSVVDFCQWWEIDPENAPDQHALKALEQAESGLSWPENYPNLAARDEAQEKLQEFTHALDSNQKASAEYLDKLHKRINRLLGSAKVGKIALAKREFEAVTKAALKYDGKDRVQLNDRLEKAKLEVSKIEDWKDFATEPKYVALCQKMEALVGSKDHADKVSAAITKLQAQWKGLGHSASADTHWERFKTAADSAYEPCAVFFEKRHAEREVNLQKREPCIVELRQLFQTTDWEQAPDYKQIENKMQSIHSAWQKIKDVEQGAGQKQWKRYSKVRQSIYKKLDVVYEANIELKRSIVEQAKKLLEAEVKEDSFSKLQFLQSKWKEVGVTRRKDDQKVWKQYKKTTDAVFEKIQAQRAKKRASEDQEIAGHRELINQLFALSKGAQDLALADKSYQEIQAQYAELPSPPKDFPAKLLERIEGDFKRAKQAYSDGRDRLKRNAKQQVFSALQEKAALCQQIEALVEVGDTDEVESLKQAYLESPLSNKDFQKQLDGRFKNVSAKDRSDFSTKRRALCIDIEILLGIESPKADSALRTKIQLERMQKKGFGHQAVKSQDQLKQMKMDWLCWPGAESEQQLELDERFKAAIAVDDKARQRKAKNSTPTKRKGSFNKGKRPNKPSGRR